MATKAYRYYQARIPAEWYGWRSDLERMTGIPDGPRPTGVTKRVLFTPDIGVYLCSFVPCVSIEELDYMFTWADGDYDRLDDDAREWWHESEVELSVSDHHYRACSDVFDRFAQVEDIDPEAFPFVGVFKSAVFQGEYADDPDNDDEDGRKSAMEDAQGNYLV